MAFVYDLLILYPTNISAKTNMPPKSTRVQKPANRLPKSLAALPIDLPEPLDLPIDPQLLDVAVDDDDDVDGYIEGTQPQSPSSTSSDPFERAVILDDLQQPTCT